MNNMINKLVQISGKGLETEDRFITRAMRANDAAYHGRESGILRNDYREAYFQYIVGRALIAEFPYPVSFEDGNRNDLVIKYDDPNSTRSFAIVEMKQWWEDGPKEPEAIRKDVDLKLRNCEADWGLMMVFAHNLNDKEATKFGETMGIMRNSIHSFHFPSLDAIGTTGEFWLLVLARISHSSTSSDHGREIRKRSEAG